jgi:hypothetical protein
VVALEALTSGSYYTFRLTAASASTGVSGYAEVQLLVNSPPTSGSLAVSPSTGYALTTSFLCLASGWVDDAEDLPLTYATFAPVTVIVTVTRDHRYEFKFAVGVAASQSSVPVSTEKSTMSADLSNRYHHAGIVGLLMVQELCSAFP